jgi:hypothetical protein
MINELRSQWMQLEDIILIEVRFRKRKIICFLSFVRGRYNIIKTGYTKGRSLMGEGG